MSRRFQSIFLTLLLVWAPLAFFNRAADGFTLTKELTAAIAIAFFSVQCFWELRWIFRQPLVQAAVLFVFWMVLDSFGVGFLKMEVLKGSVHLLLILGALLAVVFASSRGFSYEKAVRFAVLTGAVIALYGIIQSLGLDRTNWNTQFERRAFATLGNPDYLGDYLAALLPLSFILTLRSLGQKTAWLWLNATLALAAGLFATRVRGAEVAAIAGLLFLAIPLVTPWGRELAQRNRLFLKVVMALVLSIGGVWLGLHWQSFSRSQQSVQQRLDTYRMVWEIVKDHPWTGIGLGQLGVQIPRYQAKPWAPSDYASHPYTYTEHVHNEFLQFWAEGGLPGLLLFLVVLTAFFWTLYRFLKNPESKNEDRELLIGVSGSLVALLIQSLSNFPLQVAPTAVLFGLLLAAPLAMRKVAAPVLRAVSMVQKVVLVFAVALTALVGLRAVAASVAFRDTVGESSLGHGQLGVYYGTRLVSLSPVNPKAWNAYAKALEVAGQPDQAFAAYQKAVGLNPNYVENLVPMANIRLQQGRFAEAVDLCRQALAVTPNYAAPLWPLAVSLFELKRFDESAKAFENYLVYAPNDFQTYLDLGVCYIQLKRKADAVEAWKKAYALNPNDPQVTQYLKSQGVKLN